MRVVLAPIGTRGDVQPLLALGLELRDRGHAVRVCAPSNFRDWVIDVGLPFFPVGADMNELLEENWGKIRNPLAMASTLRGQLEIQFEDVRKACEGAEVLVGGGVQIAGPSIAASLGIPYAYAAYCPVVMPSSEHPAPILPWQNLPVWLNRLSWRVMNRMMGWLLLPTLNRQRRVLGLAPVRDLLRHVFVGGRTLLATDGCAAGVPMEHRGNVRATGFWYLPDATELAPEVEAFLAAGPPPVYVGFGSMMADDAERMTRMVIEATRNAGQRLLIQSGWAGLGDVELPAGCMRLEGDVPHAKLFPRVAAVVHHGGAGTTASALRAGVPQVVVPHLLDQFWWAERISRLGVGVSTPPAHRLDAASLSVAIRRASGNAGLRDRAHELSLRIDPRGAAQAATCLATEVELQGRRPRSEPEASEVQ